MNTKITQKPDGTWIIEMIDSEGYHHWIDPFPTYNKAYEWLKRFFASKDDGK